MLSYDRLKAISIKIRHYTEKLQAVKYIIIHKNFFYCTKQAMKFVNHIFTCSDLLMLNIYLVELEIMCIYRGSGGF